MVLRACNNIKKKAAYTGNERARESACFARCKCVVENPGKVTWAGFAHAHTSMHTYRKRRRRSGDEDQSGAVNAESPAISEKEKRERSRHARENAKEWVGGKSSKGALDREWENAHGDDPEVALPEPNAHVFSSGHFSFRSPFPLRHPSLRSHRRTGGFTRCTRES